eukprot:GHRQ01016090.1.p1 GENE.GHRQ01016090.1~~GHRQ01016090.1.p1  ORF type:complete len:398 (+),score=167.13 GHRQ01016090.1:114-1196(+)
MVNTLEFLQNPKEIARIAVTYGDGNQRDATYTGDLILQTNGILPSLHLSNVLFVPGSKLNLLSVPQLASKGVKVEFGSECIGTLDGEVILTGQRTGNVYTVTSSSMAAPAAFVAKTPETPELWHQRLGHLGHDNLERLVHENLVKGINLKHGAFKAEKYDVCGPCALGKQQRLPFPSEGGGKTTRILDLVHTDICGPIETTKGGNRYFVSFVDDYSGYTEIHLIENRFNLSSVVIDVFTRMENYTGERIRRVRHDNGREYLSSSTTAFYKHKGITMERSMPYAPQQNGVAESFNKTLMAKVRPMLAASGLGNEYWGEAAMTATYLANLSPKAGKTKTPWELYHGFRPDVSRLRTFGCRPT